ncbi:hypothetical protein [Infirmifilum sp.]|uniref:hypothetical protein n=1 Tax=Infirmifilum sp. TaxID=2856575 RepID=UPI003D0A5865
MNNDVSFKLITGIPNHTNKYRNSLVSNPEVYEKIVKELVERSESIKEIHLALYLFNNKDLLEELVKTTSSSAEVVITSLPPAGYTKKDRDIALEVYKKVLNLNSPKLELRVYPHMYVWHGIEYAGRGPPYSFHIKAGLVVYKDGACKQILTSCNLAHGDPPRSETAIVIEDPSCSSPYSKAFKKFFEKVEQLAVPWSAYYNTVRGLDEGLYSVFDFAFVGSLGLTNWSEPFVDKAFFTGPFIKIGDVGSPWYARRKIVDLVRSAEKKLLVVAQHVHDIDPFDEYKDTTIIGAIIESKRANPSLEVKVLKQVSSRGLSDKRRAAFAECHLRYAGVEQKENRYVHDKFVVADDVVLITTANLTSTQFSWGIRQMEFEPKGRYDYDTVSEVVKRAEGLFGHTGVEVRQARGRSGLRVRVIKRDAFAEVNGFVIIENEALANKLAEHFERLWSHRLSKPVEILEVR